MGKIKLERRFTPTKEKQLSDPDYLLFFSEMPSGVRDWDQLLIARPTLVLAEGRSGKTYEFQKQIQKLKLEGKFAFFIPPGALTQ